MAMETGGGVMATLDQCKKLKGWGYPQDGGDCYVNGVFAFEGHADVTVGRDEVVMVPSIENLSDFIARKFGSCYVVVINDSAACYLAKLQLPGKKDIIPMIDDHLLGPSDSCPIWADSMWEALYNLAEKVMESDDKA